MKFTPLSAVAIALLFISSPVSMAAPTSENTLKTNVTRPFTFPAILAGRTAVPSKLPHVNLSAEKNAMKSNGPLPANVEQKGGMGLNSTTIDLSAASFGISRRADVYATAAKVQELKVYTTLSANAYCRSVVPGNEWDCKHCSTDDTLVYTFDSSKYDTNGYIARNDKLKVINLVFRGTSSLENFVADFEFIAQSYPPVSGAKVHTGFYKAYLDVQKEVLSNMIEQIAAFPNYQVVASGHSLGGALATLGVLDLYQRDSRFNAKNLAVRTYGGPRVGNPTFAYYVTGTGIDFERTVHKQDIVPHLPPQSFGFLHPGVEYWIKDGDNVKICGDTLDSEECSNSIVPFTKLTDHLSYFDINTGLCL
ncbi:lipase lipRs [Phycomyces blakesleeanus]|uniref:Lipase lipRs n=1 Tax=Phycomyces blakesleeanus TaxID=4837 RepID=A0ABR3AT13_PHYBL